MIEARYLVETPLDPSRVAEIMAREQSTGTFVKVAGETEELHRRAGARVLAVEELAPLEAPSLRSAYLERLGVAGPWRRAYATIAYHTENIGVNLPTLAATVAGNLYDLGEVTGLRLVNLRLSPDYRAQYLYPHHGVSGTRTMLKVQDRPMLGTIIKPNIGMAPDEIADLVEILCEAGVDFIKDDEVCANSVCAPLAQRVTAVMDHVRRYRERTGRPVMIAFNISDGVDQMRRHAELVEQEGGSCVMASLNWCGLSAMEALRRSTDLVIHGHRNGFGAFARHPALGIGFAAYQTLYRLAGVDHLHVHGIGGKFSDQPEEVGEAARICLEPLDVGCDDRVLPVFSSGQWAGTLPQTTAAVGSADFMFLAGGGILAHPGGPAAGVKSLKQAWQAIASGADLMDHAAGHPELAAAFSSFGGKAGS